jgi:hypothetical protein
MDLPFGMNDGWAYQFLHPERIHGAVLGPASGIDVMRKLIGFDNDTLDKLTQLGRDRMATIQELADEAFADLLKKHGVPVDLKDALRKSVTQASQSTSTRRAAVRANNPSSTRKHPDAKRAAKRPVRRR